MRVLLLSLPASCLLLGCASRGPLPSASAAVAGPVDERVSSDSPSQGLPWAAPPLERAVSVRDGRTGEALSFEDLLDRIAQSDAVFLGETHIDETTHRVELGVFEGLLSRRRGRVVLAMEMFERDVQPYLDEYLAGHLEEEEFLAHARPWKNYRTAYRPLVEAAKREGRPVIASNFPAPLRRRVAMEGAAALDALEGDARRQVPEELFPNTKAYWRRVDNAIRGHLGMMGGRSGDEDERLTSTQTLWDNSMGESCARALDEFEGDLVLHVNGGFHSAYWDGTVRQLLLRKPDARVVTIAIVPAMNPAVSGPSGAPWADYVIYAEARATDLNDGTWSVYVPRELEYRLHLPEGASAEAPVPLLIWLSDDGFTAQDGMALWKERLGQEAAIAVLEAPYRETQDDLSEGGRWYWPDSFTSDIGVLETAAERIRGYLLRHYPIDPLRVCLAGEGTGATVVAAVSLLTERMDVRAVGLLPSRYAKIKDFPLPLPELRGDDLPPAKSLRLIVDGDDEAWWTGELAEYEAIGFDSALVQATTDPWQREIEGEQALRSALGLEPRRPSTGQRRHVLVRGDSLRARHWARLVAVRYQEREGAPVAVLEEPPAEGSSEPIPVQVQAQDYAGAEELPRCPGPFGGTTVVVLLDGTPASEVEGWISLEENDPLHQRSRFHRLRVATTDGERRLADVLAKLRNEKRMNVLIVPAAFCAEGSTMRSLKRSVRGFADRMTLHWKPGLGAGE